MVATTYMIAGASALAANRVASKFSAHADSRIDAGIKAAAGLALILGSTQVKVEPVKAAMMGAGIGLGLAAVGEFVPFLA